MQFKSSSTFRALSSGAICLKILPFGGLFFGHVVFFLWHLDVEKLRYLAKTDSTFVVSFEKWASNKERTSSFVLNIYRNSSNDEKMYGDDCLSCSRIHEWFKRFQEGRPRNVVNEENAEIVREFIRKEPKSSLKYMESELGISAASIYRILT